MQADALGRAVIDGHDEGPRPRPSLWPSRAPHHIGRAAVVIVPLVRLRAVRVAHAVRGLEVVPHPTDAPSSECASRRDPRDPELRPGFPVPFAVLRGFEQSADVAGQHVRPGRRPPAHAADTAPGTLSPAAAHTR